MRKVVLCLALAFWACLLSGQHLSPTNRVPVAGPAAGFPQRFEFKEGDRIVFLGDPWMGDEQKDGYIETMLASRSGGKKASFRNLAPSAVPVAGRSRASLDPLEKGLKRLIEPLEAIKPTVAVLAYGLVESGNGQAGLERFKRGINKLMDTVTNISSPEPVRFVIVTPPFQEAPPAGVSEAAPHNAQLELYAKALRDIAQERNARLVDLFEAMRKQHSRPGMENWMDDGFHPTPYGYWQIAGVFEWYLNIFPGIERIGIGVNNSIRRGGAGIVPENITRTEQTMRFTGRDEFVLRPLEPKRGSATNKADGFLIQFYPMPPGNYTLKIDGEISAVGSGQQWMNAATVSHGPLFDRVEALRQAIIKKNELCFQRRDRTYLLGFRTSKKGRNAEAISKADPVIAAEEEKIFRLMELKARQYEVAPSQPGDEQKLKAHEAKPS